MGSFFGANQRDAINKSVVGVIMGTSFTIAGIVKKMGNRLLIDYFEDAVKKLSDNADAVIFVPV